MQQETFETCAAVPALPEDALWIAEWRETGSCGALARLVRAHAGAVRAMARVWARRTALQDDLVSEGMLALIACLDGYVPRAGVRFFAYARPFVRAAMRRTFYRDALVVAMPLSHVRMLREGRGSAADEALFRGAAHPERLDAPDAPDLGAECDTGEAGLIRAEVERGRRVALETALAALTETDRLFVERRRADSPCSLPELARRIGVSPGQAARIEARALARLRTQLILRGVTSSDGGAV